VKVVGESGDNTVTMRINKEKNISNSELISQLASQYEIISFAEELPSMNDIFLSVVK
jgi:ABC-2 type transport system ATP-binding protein